MLSLYEFLKFNIEHTLIYYPEDVGRLCEDIRSNIKIKIYKKRNGAEYLNIPCSFDIETSSWYDKGEKVANMYLWGMSICGLIVIGRTWFEFLEVLKVLQEEFGLLAGEKHLVLYVQNLSYEFQFCRGWLEWLKVFAVDTREAIDAVSSYGIEFKCSYVLSAYSLAKMGEHLTMFNVQKTDGLQYYEKRHSESVITWNELRYQINDVQVVVAFIFEEMERNKGNITKIPLTNTGYVRSFCRRACLQGFENNPKTRKYKRFRYTYFIHNLNLIVDEYEQARRAFMGGYSHTNPFYANLLVEDFISEDFSSAYPAKAVLLPLFPISQGELIDPITPELFKTSCELYFCMFDVIFEGLESTFLYDNYISVSRCWEKQNYVKANGRLVRGDVIGTTITNYDFDIIKRTYKWQKMKVARFRRYKRGYLPTDLVKAILSLYKAKTELKDVDEMIVEYFHSKGMLNSTYGMICQAVFKDNSIYDMDADEWKVERADPEKEIEKYNTSPNRFLYYLWALVITATCRRDLWSGILACGEDYIYSDTDSLKVRNYEKHRDYFEGFNNNILKLIDEASEFHGIPKDDFMPKTIKGKQKIIGVWDFDGAYMLGKFLGSKRYLLQKWDGEFILTISGVNKKIGLKYLLDKYGEFWIWDNFTDKLFFPKGSTGKLTHTYIDDERTGVMTDYQGVKSTYYEKSAVHLEETEYSLSMSEYLDYIESLENETSEDD